MQNCRVCFADIIWAEDQQTGENVPLDAHEERDGGLGRYKIMVDGTKPKVTAIAEESPLRTYVDHRLICQEPRVV